MGSLISHETIIDNNADSSMKTSLKSHVYILKGRGLDKGMLRGKGGGECKNKQKIMVCNVQIFPTPQRSLKVLYFLIAVLSTNLPVMFG